MFAQCIVFARFTADNGRFRKLLLRALSEGWVRPRELTHACISVIKLNNAVNDAIDRVNAVWPARLAAAALLDSPALSAIANDLLLRCLLETDPATDIGLERLLTNLRGAMLMSVAAETAAEDSLLEFYCSVARQCFLNEYIFSTTADEFEQAQQLRTSLERALASGSPFPAQWPVAVGAYLPLHTLANADRLFDWPWPTCVNALLIQQIGEPAEERRLAATIPTLTDIEDAVSRAVRQQYEENPYPRWHKAGPPARPAIMPRGGLHNVLIAGCGTGLSTIELARQSRDARVLAIDLSLASLSYAMRMAREFGLTNIEFGQADIMSLGSLGRGFDFIDASGVLHHLADPWAGWRILLSLLQPGGVMQIGLYSERARRNVAAVRALIAERGYQPNADDIRRCREEIIASDDPLLRSVTNASGFFAISECRDFLFHVQEHRTTLPEIKSFLTANNLEFVGFFLDALTLRTFATRFPEPSSRADLDCWHTFEAGAPNTFSEMYQFSIRKRA
jgi:SAM-dependent methyltransferase